MPAIRPRLRLAIVSPDPSTVSPTGAYTAELVRALRIAAPEIVAEICAIGRAAGSSPDVAVTIAADDPTDYRRAAHRLRALGTDVVLVQYRPDAAAGPRTRHLLPLCDELARLAVPYLVLLHDVRRCPLPNVADVMAALCRRASGVAVLSDPAAAVVVHHRIAAADQIAVIPPGAPPELSIGPVREPSAPALRAALTHEPVLSTVGPMRPAKGIHVAIAALAAIARHHPDVRYLVAERFPDPAPHPYRQALRAAVLGSGLDGAVCLLTPAVQAAAQRVAADIAAEIAAEPRTRVAAP